MDTSNEIVAMHIVFDTLFKSSNGINIEYNSSFDDIEKIYSPSLDKETHLWLLLTEGLWW